MSTPVLAALLQTGWNLSLHKEPHGEDKGQQVQVALGEVSSQHKNEIFYSEINHWNNLTMDVAGPITRGSQAVIGQDAPAGCRTGQSHLGSLSHTLDRMIFQGPFQPGLFPGSMIYWVEVIF